MKELRDIVREFQRAAGPMALATIVRTTGSSYRKSGARMLVFPDGRTVGTLSGGCIEQEVAQRARQVIASGTPALFEIDTLKRFGCHGSIEIFVERIEPDNAFLTYLARCFASRATARIVVVFEGAARLGSMPRTAAAYHDGGGFEQNILPPVRLLILGEGPGSETLGGMAHLLGWDSRQIELTETDTLQPDARTAVVIKQHHFGRAFTALQWALSKNFGYVGLLGSEKRKRQLMNSLLEQGAEVVAEEALEHFHGPAGLDLGADSPDEIALAIIAEIQAVLTHHAAGFLRDRQGPIHAVLCPAMA